MKYIRARKLLWKQCTIWHRLMFRCKGNQKENKTLWRAADEDVTLSRAEDDDRVSHNLRKCKLCKDTGVAFSEYHLRRIPSSKRKNESGGDPVVKRKRIPQPGTRQSTRKRTHNAADSFQIVSSGSSQSPSTTPVTPDEQRVRKTARMMKQRKRYGLKEWWSMRNLCRSHNSFLQ